MSPDPLGLPDDMDDSQVPDLSGRPGSSEAARDATPVLTAPQRIAVWEVANGKSRAEAARRAGVCEKTLYRWSRTEWYAAAVAEASAMVVDITAPNVAAGKALVRGSTFEAAKELVDLATGKDDDGNPAYGPDIRLRAIGKIFEVSELTGQRGGQQTNVQVNVDLQTQVADDMAEAKRIMAEVRDGEAAPDA